MFTRKRNKSRSGDAPFCRLCGTQVRVDFLGQCRLGHQTVDVGFAAVADGFPPAAPDVEAFVPVAAVDDFADDAPADLLPHEVLPADALLSADPAPGGDVDPVAAWMPATSSWTSQDHTEPEGETRRLDGGGHHADEVEDTVVHTRFTAVAADETAGLARLTGEPPVDPTAPDAAEGVPGAGGAAGGVAADAARQRLLEAASWFAASEDEPVR